MTTFRSLAPLWLMLATSAASVYAQTERGTRPATVLRPRQVVDVRSGTAVPGAVVIVRGSRVEHVGPAPSLPPDATIIDLPGVTLFPD